MGPKRPTSLPRAPAPAAAPPGAGRSLLPAVAFAWVSSKEGEASRARSMKSLAAGDSATASTSGVWVGSGTSRGGTGYCLSPLTCKALDLVASTARLEHEPTSKATSVAASSRCSKLSSNKSSLFLAQAGLKHLEQRLVAGQP